MKALLSPFVLRRLKSQVASQLTAKQQHEEVISMTPEQAALYQKAVQQLRADVAVNMKGIFAPSCRVLCTSPLCHRQHRNTHCVLIQLVLSSFEVVGARSGKAAFYVMGSPGNYKLMACRQEDSPCRASSGEAAGKAACQQRVHPPAQNCPASPASAQSVH